MDETQLNRTLSMIEQRIKEIRRDGADHIDFCAASQLRKALDELADVAVHSADMKCHPH